MVFSVDDNDGLFCPDVDVKHVELDDVKRMDDLDESLYLDFDVKIDG